ncbi:MAG TPA: TetR/AcrR family transcriptional regulator [Longimicrobiales bacterium]|nr:TetR/AcrR family transcriptional regulator [Longimicrobiales bacterium]
MAEERRNYDEKLAHILRTAAAIFADKGYHEASIRDISRATGVSLSGLYYYFSSKEELLYLIQDHCFTTLAENLDQLLAQEPDGLRRFQLMVENHLRFFVNNMKEMKVLSHELDSLTGEFRQTVNAKKRQYTDVCSGVLQAVGPPGTKIDARVAIFALFGMMNWIYNWYHPDRDVPVAKLAEDMSQLFLRGFLTGAAGGAEWRSGASLEPSPSIWRT